MLKEYKLEEMGQLVLPGSNLKVDLNQQKDKVSAIVTFDVKNTGNADGAEVAQLYVSDLVYPVVRPVKELKGFSKVFLKKGETKRISLTLDESAFSYYKINAANFVFDAGDFKILVGGLSKNMPLQKTINLK